MLPQVEFAYNAFRALGFEHTPFETNFGFSPEEPPLYVVECATFYSGFTRRVRAVQIVPISTYYGTFGTKTICKHVRNRRQPHISSEETTCQLLQPTSSYLGK
jgi:hypothetical protein